MLKGFDCSKYQNKPDFKKAKAGGMEFCILRSNYGFTVDRDFIYNINAAKDAGLITGTYSFPTYDQKAKPQADFYLDLINKYPCDFVAMDVEYCPNIPFPQPLPYRTWCSEFLEALKVYGKEILIYTSPNIIQNVLVVHKTSILLQYSLWIANYGVATPSIEPWKEWKFWQYALGKGEGYKYGMNSKDIDLDYFNGSLEDLKQWLKVEPSKPLTYEQKVDILWKEHFG